VEKKFFEGERGGEKMKTVATERGINATPAHELRQG